MAPLNCQYAAGSGRTQATLAATNKCLAQSNKSRAVGKSTKNSEARLC